jgi:hypothetical protein
MLPVSVDERLFSAFNFIRARRATGCRIHTCLVAAADLLQHLTFPKALEAWKEQPPVRRRTTEVDLV